MTKHYLSFTEKLEVVFITMWRSAKLLVRFKISFLISIIGMFVSIIIFFFFGKIFGDATAIAIAKYGGEYFPYVLTGLAFNHYATISLRSYLKTVKGVYWSNWLEIILTSPMRLKTFYFSAMAWTYFYATINILLYLFMGIWIFGAQFIFSSGWYVIIVILFLMIISVSGIGLMAASTFLLLDAKGEVEPISWAVATVTSLVCGIFYPPELLPSSLQFLSKLFPHTYALEGIRQVLLMGENITSSDILVIIVKLIIFSVILLPLGMAMFKLGIKKAEREGTLARWA